MESLQKIHKEKVDTKTMAESRNTWNTRNLPARLQADQALFQAFHRYQAFFYLPFFAWHTSYMQGPWLTLTFCTHAVTQRVC